MHCKINASTVYRLPFTIYRLPFMRTLPILVFTAGFVTLGVELSAARLLEPAFGNNQIIWAALIGMILLYLAVGAWLGGLLADRWPQRRALDLTLTLAAVGVASIPVLAPAILRLAAQGLVTFAPQMLVGALLAIATLFCAPVVLLGVTTPWALRLSVTDVQQSGRVAGRLSALATVGSLLGAFVPVLWLTPSYGTRWTFFLLALLLLAALLLGAIGQRHWWLPLVAFVLIVALAYWSKPGGSIRSGWDDGSEGRIIYEDESLYNYIAVRQWGSERHLKLNDGIGIHSIYHPDSLLSHGIWDYFLLAPLFSNYAIRNTKYEIGNIGCEMRESAGEAKVVQVSSDFQIQNPKSKIQNLLILGSAAGTVSELYTTIYGAIPITGIELDPQIIEIGQRYFNMEQANLTAIAADGRRWLAQQPSTAKWDVIAIDAYRPPYIPFHLTTLEFFSLVRQHLSEDGVLAINVGRTASNYDLVNALAATVGQHFPSLYQIDEPGPRNDLGNSLLVASMRPTHLDQFRNNVADLIQEKSFPAEFRSFTQKVQEQTHAVQIDPTAAIFSDDRAPVERLVHGIIWSFLTTS